MYTLYYAPDTLSTPLHWLLIHLGVGFQLERVDFQASAQCSPAYIAVNPKGKVPALTIDEDGTTGTYTEFVALALILAERHSDAGLFPTLNHPLRPKALELAIYLSNTLLASSRDYIYAFKDAAHPEQDGPAIRRLAATRLAACFERLDAELEVSGGPYLLGKTMSILDFALTAVLTWSSSRAVGALSIGQGHLETLARKMVELDSWRTVWEREGLADSMKDWPDDGAQA